MLDQGRVSHRTFHRPVLYTSVALFSVCNFSGAHADWAETLGIGQKSSNLGGAVTATSNDFDAFFTNPAGAANFSTPFFGAGVKFLDVRGLNVTQSDVAPFSPPAVCTTPVLGVSGLCGSAPLNGLSLSPQGTLPGAAIAALPSFGAYSPLPGFDNKVVVGVGVGSPFNISAVYGNTGVPGNYGQFDTTSAGMVIVETSPTIALKLSDRLNVGASVGITTFKYLQIGSTIGAPNATLPVFGPSALGALGIGSMNLQTASSVKLPGIEPGFDTAPTDVSVTLGAQYKFTDRLTGGVTYRSKTPETFTGTATATVNDIQSAPIGVLGTLKGFTGATDQFTYKVELPADVQAGLAYDVTPQWKIMGDVRWTNWSDAQGFGTPGVISLANGTIDPGKVIAGQAGTSALAAILTAAPPIGGGVHSAPIQTITTGYNAHDTFSFHFGTSYKLTPNFELQAGYVYDPSFISASSMDLITLSSNRHIFSLGGTYTLPTSRGGEWAITLGAQLVDYEHRHIALNQSSMLGGINGLQATLSNNSNLTYEKNNTLGGLDIGGYVWSAGLSISYKFGVDAPLITK